jgi:hypothetical protein
MIRAYKGYLIRSTLSGTAKGGDAFVISKGGAHICYAPTVEQAQRIIDGLLSRHQ